MSYSRKDEIWDGASGLGGGKESFNIHEQRSDGLRLSSRDLASAARTEKSA
ncbi:hypothetical protein COLO4_13561 [Corchorus olitorius]|uniref:Uncharacterized protein n=1 Tax=Corchorus olitorius TaxID=93759 RepID=A0A1R3JW45_9ROSI|nr:hypothetical protein COLO4_13561 [Corchorus olitorius]